MFSETGQSLGTVRHFQLAKEVSASSFLVPTEKQPTDLCWQLPHEGKERFGLKLYFKGFKVEKPFLKLQARLDLIYLVCLP